MNLLKCAFDLLKKILRIYCLLQKNRVFTRQEKNSKEQLMNDINFVQKKDSNDPNKEGKKMTSKIRKQKEMNRW